MREIVLDTETTGLSPEKGDRIVEIACIELINHLPTENCFQVYINPEREMSKEAIEITGITDEFLKDKPLFKDVAEDFLNFIKSDPLIIHNAKFDVKFLNYELNTLHNFNHHINLESCIDTLAIAKLQFPGAAVSLDALCKKFSIDRSKRTKHGALIDCELLADVYLQLIGGHQRQLFDANSKSKESKKEMKVEAKQIKTHISAKPFKEPRIFPINQTEFERHKEFIKNNIKNSIWEFLKNEN